MASNPVNLAAVLPWHAASRHGMMRCPRLASAQRQESRGTIAPHHSEPSLKNIRLAFSAFLLVALTGLAACAVGDRTATGVNCDNQQKGRHGSTELDCEKGR
jgi:hypothetical protein